MSSLLIWGLQGQPGLNETLPKDKNKTKADKHEEGFFFFLSQKRPLSQGNNCDCCGNSDLHYKTPCWGARLHGAIGGEPGSLKQWQRMGSGREWEREVGRQCRDRAYTCVLGTQTLSESPRETPRET